MRTHSLSARIVVAFATLGGLAAYRLPAQEPPQSYIDAFGPKNPRAIVSARAESNGDVFLEVTAAYVDLSGLHSLGSELPGCDRNGFVTFEGSIVGTCRHLLRTSAGRVDDWLQFAPLLSALHRAGAAKVAVEVGVQHWSGQGVEPGGGWERHERSDGITYTFYSGTDAAPPAALHVRIGDFRIPPNPALLFVSMLLAAAAAASAVRMRAERKPRFPALASLIWIHLGVWAFWFTAFPPSLIGPALAFLPVHSMWLDLWCGALLYLSAPLLAIAVTVTVVNYGRLSPSTGWAGALSSLWRNYRSELHLVLFAGFPVTGVALAPAYGTSMTPAAGILSGLLAGAGAAWLARRPAARRLEPLVLGDLRERAATIARSAGVDLKGVGVVLDGSNGANAFANPLRRQIFFTYSLIEKMTGRELDSLIAHETAHLFEVITAPLVPRLYWTYCPVYLAYWIWLRNGGAVPFQWTEPLLWLPALAGLLLVAWASREREYRADLRAVRITQDPHGLIAALARLAMLRREPPAWGRLLGAVLSHPPLRDRVLHIAAQCRTPELRALEIMENPDVIQGAAAPPVMSAGYRMRQEEGIAFAAQKLAKKAEACLDHDAAMTLFAEAYEKCRALLEMNPRHVLGLRVWGLALCSNAVRLPRAEADRLYSEAAGKYAAALTIVPGDAYLMASMAHATLRRAQLSEGEAAAGLLALAREQCESALRIQPVFAHVRILWAHALCGQARLTPGEEMDRTLAEARATIEAEATQAVDADKPLRALAAILFAQGMRASGGESVRLLREAKEKFLASESRVPGTGAYRAACVCARLGEEEECRRWLEASHEPGILVTRDELAAEPHFESVRGRDWFPRVAQAGATR